jgi:hypothetical protein
LILLAGGGRFDLLQVAADAVVAPASVVEQLRDAGMYLSDRVVTEALRLVGE